MLTDSQRRVLQYIESYLAQHGYAPKIKEIAEGIGIRSKSAAHRYVQALAEASYIRILPKRARGIELTAKAQSHTMPLVGTIAAGTPIEALAGQETLDLSTWFHDDGHTFALKVKGESMIDKGILHGDIVICRAQAQAQPNEIAVVLVNEQEATLKFCHPNPDDTVTLIPANTALQPKTYPAKHIQIQGVVIGQIRKYT